MANKTPLLLLGSHKSDLACNLRPKKPILPSYINTPDILKPVLEIRQLTKQFGRRTAVNGLDMEVQPGTVYGLLGPNGSGKTTTLAMLLDIVKPTSGSFSWFGEAPNHESRKRLGAILETPNFYPYLSGYANLEIAASIKGASPKRIPEVLELVNLAERGNDKFRTYSLGMKQRLSIASAILGNPEVLILDEPTNGLDPQGIAEVRGLIKRIAQDGTTILLASHLLDEVQKVCTHVAVLNQGKTVYSGAVEAVLGDAVAVDVAAKDLAKLEQAARSFGATLNVKPLEEMLRVDLEVGTKPEDLNAHLIAQGITLSHLAMVKQSLEHKFLELLADSPAS